MDMLKIISLPYGITTVMIKDFMEQAMERGTSWRVWRGSLARWEYAAIRDSLIEAELAEWNNAADPRLGWRLLVDSIGEVA